MLPILLVGDMRIRTRVPKLLGQAKVDDIDEVRAMARAHDKVRGLDVAMNEAALVYEFDARNLV